MGKNYDFRFYFGKKQITVCCCQCATVILTKVQTNRHVSAVVIVVYNAV
jgi:hypothetical protein